MEENRRELKGIERVFEGDPMAAIRSGQLGLGDAIRLGHHNIVGKYLGSTMPPSQAANTYRDLVSGVAGWY